MKNNRILALSIITLLGSAHGVATAITLSAAGSSSPVKFAKELPTSTSLIGFSNAADGYVVNIAPIGVKVSPTNNVYVKFNLLNGAKFNSDLADAALTCASGSEAVGSYAGINATKTVGGAGQSFATFQLAPTGGTAALGSACQLKIVDLTLSGMTDKSISATVEYNDAGAAKVLASKGQFITFTQALAVTYTPNASPVKIDVGQSSKKFVSGTSNTNTAMVGNIQYAAISTTIYNASGAALNVASALVSVKLTVTGPAVGSVHSGNAGTSGVFLAANGQSCQAYTSPMATAVASPITRSYSGTTVTFNGVSVTALADNMKVCIVNNGTNIIADGQITANLTVTSTLNNMVPDLTATRNALATFKKNGSATKALVLPDPNQSDKPYVRIYNISSNSTGRVLGTLYGVDGKAIASGVLSAALGPNATVVLGAPEIAKALGITGWTGRPWLQIEAEFQGLRAQALIRSSTGVLTEFSDAACGTSALCGDAQ